MGYIKKIECSIIPEKSFKIIHNCSGCKGKTNYINTEKFRINANGNKLDVWLIYQCEKCKHTYNVSIYERQKVSRLSKEEYGLFLENNKELAQEYGRDFQLFTKNKLEVDLKDIEYNFIDSKGEKFIFAEMMFEDGQEIIIENPYGLKIRKEKLASEILMISRSKTKKMLDNNNIILFNYLQKIKIEIIRIKE